MHFWNAQALITTIVTDVRAGLFHLAEKYEHPCARRAPARTPAIMHARPTYPRTHILPEHLTIFSLSLFLISTYAFQKRTQTRSTAPFLLEHFWNA